MLQSLLAKVAEEVCGFICEILVKYSHNITKDAIVKHTGLSDPQGFDMIFKNVCNRRPKPILIFQIHEGKFALKNEWLIVRAFVEERNSSKAALW